MSFLELTDLRRHYAGQAGRLTNEFYVPVLRHAVRYDRQAGFFDSASLVQLASGFAAFIHKQQDLRSREGPPSVPPMRLITGATWTQDDIEAYQRGLDALKGGLGLSLVRHFEPTEDECVRLGLPPGWRPEQDEIARHRLGALAWLVSNGILDVRIALPLDHNGRPYRPGRHGALYHPKAGVLHDEEGNTIAFQGSVNETSAAWARNREKFEVKRSWFSRQDEEDIRHEIEEFETIWDGDDPGLLVLPLPKAVEEYMVGLVPPDGPPQHDPLEVGIETRKYSPLERIQAQWMLDAPKKPGGEQLVLAPLWADGKPLQPFPHQATVYARALRTFPRSSMFCDEVGLGKTIEAGLLLRSLMIKGKLGRVLLLPPASLVRQWMEELREKFALTAWFYDGRVLRDVGGRVRVVSDPVDQDGVLLVSRHLAVRRDRRDEFLRAKRPWGVVIVDEAHAARRRVMGNTNEPNLALEFLQELHGRRLAQCLWLLTATPMQLNTREVHDLLMLCGLDDPTWRPWDDLYEFNRFFEQLRAFPRNQQVRTHVVRMARMAVEHGAPDLDRDHVPGHWDPFKWENFVARITSSSAGRSLALLQLTGTEAEALTPYLSRQTPLSVHMFRYTRATLRAYQERQMVQGLAVRKPEDVAVDFETATERELYHRIDDLCRSFYKLADLPEGERSGVGFLMAVFRKRLSSSFASLKRSLERRRDLIRSIQQSVEAFEAKRALVAEASEEQDDDDDGIDPHRVVDDEHARLLRIFHNPRRRAQLEKERVYLQNYIARLGQIDKDSKFQTFKARLLEVVTAGERVIVFTQYLDTLDFIRERLVGRFADQMACYSGRGGEVWDPGINDWRLVEKAEVKARCKSDHPHAVRILLATDAASEGLNLQEFSALFNYDLPWNPMRVEQRIGRIDRIGQDAETVTILNLYIRDTIEEDAYFTMRDRITLFQDVVGPLQPILARMPRILRQVARGEIERSEAVEMLDRAAREKPESAIAALEQFVADVPEADRAGAHDPAATQERLAFWCLAHPAPGMRIAVVPEPGLAGIESDGTRACLAITWVAPPERLGIDAGDEILATFSGEMADRHPPTAQQENETRQAPAGREGVRLLTWGDPLLTAWLTAVRGEPLTLDDYRAVGIDENTDPFGLE